MKRCVGLLFAALLGCGRAHSALAVAAQEYPLGVGHKWTYGSIAKVSVVRQIRRTVQIDGRTYYEMEFVLPVLGPRTLPMRHTAEGVVTAREGREFLLMRFPMVKGDRWTIDLPGEKEIADCTVVGQEEIEFAGRKGTATRLEVRRRNRETGSSWTDYEWYAKGAGLVKMEVTFGIRATFVLESFTRPNQAGVPE